MSAPAHPIGTTKGKNSCEVQFVDVTHSLRDNRMDVLAAETECDSVFALNAAGVSVIGVGGGIK